MCTQKIRLNIILRNNIAGLHIDFSMCLTFLKSATQTFPWAHFFHALITISMVAIPAFASKYFNGFEKKNSQFSNVQFDIYFRREQNKLEHHLRVFLQFSFSFLSEQHDFMH